MEQALFQDKNSQGALIKKLLLTINSNLAFMSLLLLCRLNYYNKVCLRTLGFYLIDLAEIKHG